MTALMAISALALLAGSVVARAGKNGNAGLSEHLKSGAFVCIAFGVLSVALGL